MGCSDERSAKQEFFTSLERTGAGYFDFYLLHALQSWNYTKYDEYKIWDFAAEQKAKGLIKNLGFSLHAKPELLDDLLTRHPEVDFVQLQLNYADWENPSVTSRENWEIARKHNKPIVVMEPVKGGILANPPQQVKALFTEADPSASMASWAVRFAASLDGVITVLSGMSSIEQMENNISYMKGFKPLDEKEKGVIKAAQDELLKIDAIPCTACHYCTAGCPKHISIPDIFAAMNISLTYGNTASAKQQYAIATMSGGGKASDCIACGQCERACPQQIKVIEQLKRCAAALE
jgi:predicted aldo/keto reductase-like oxidoreductase